MIRPEDIANEFIIRLTKTQYQCETRKLQKLIIFTDFLYFAKYKTRLLDEECITASSKGLSIDKISNGIYGVFIFNVINKREPITNNEIKNQEVALAPVFQYNPNVFSGDQIQIIDEVFFSLGAYSGDDLTKISKNTFLWVEARKNTFGDYDPPITTALYKEFLDYIKESCKTENPNSNQIIKYLVER